MKVVIQLKPISDSPDEIENFILNRCHTYTFVGENEVFAIDGKDILLVKFIK